MLKKKKWLVFGGVVMATLLIVSIFAAAFPKKKACKHVFDEGTVAIAATCTTDGKTIYTCTECGETETEVIPAGHTYGEWTVDVAATCTTEGSQKRVCTACGYTETESVLLVHEDLNQDCLCDNCFLVVTSPTELGYKETPYVEGTPVAGTWFRVYNPYKDKESLYLKVSTGLSVMIRGEGIPSYPDVFEIRGPNSQSPVNMDMYNDNQDGYIDFYLPAKTYSVFDITVNGYTDIELTETDVFEDFTLLEGWSIYILEE